MPSAMPSPSLDPRAEALSISNEAMEIYASSEVIDLHVDTFIWSRIFRYDMTRRHGHGPFGARFFSQVDLPRLIEAGMTGAVFSVTTNPFLPRAFRSGRLFRNVVRLRDELERHPQVAVVKDHAGYQSARAAGRTACFIGIQGGNAVDSSPEDVENIPEDLVTRITLVHLSNSTLGVTSSPAARRDTGLTDFGREYVRRMNGKRILVDLAHISRKGFWDALEVHDRTQPAIVSHTGVCGVTPHWRNLDDAQVKAIADLGGVVGIIFHGGFLGESYWGGTADGIAAHIAHVIQVAGDDFVALGSDWDGMICTPRDMKTVLELPVLVQRLLDRGVRPESVHKLLGANYLRVMKEIRPGA